MTATDLLRDQRGASTKERDPRDPVGAREAHPALETSTTSASGGWYKDAVIYELHVRAFRDANGDGIGDFKGLIEKLDYLQGLGVTALWLLPFYPSPLRDDGYDISDYRQVHPCYGTLRDFRRFLAEAHRRSMRVITELVLAHTSDAHEWFQRARRAKPGSSHRDFYLWSDTPDRFSGARVIFKDFEASNWSFDPVAGAYFWHRFYSHQPSLNYDNPAVCEAMFDIVDFWLDMGVDGLRLDAVPYLYAREGTTCENLPETFAYLRRLRAHIDERFKARMLLAEANQWPEDAVAYMGQGDICQMAFHFPLMPRMFMAARQEDRFPIVDILSETPTTPPDGQWALFLRNHDELTLEMVSDEERDYMYRAYAQDPQARVNVGIRRRLAPLLSKDRKLIEMMNGLLFSMPGTPIIYYGDEIGMGDNIYLGDRNAVRTPMQWNSDRNAGFSAANPQRLFLPVIIDPEYHSQAVNVEAQQQNPTSLLWWMKRLVALRQRHRAFGRGSLQVLQPDNRKVFAFVRRFENEAILCVFNLARHVQCVELDLSEFRGATPVELFGNLKFPAIGELPYFITLGPHGFYWFSLEREPKESTPKRRSFRVSGQWDSVFRGAARRQFEAFLPSYLAERRWFVQKGRTITSASIADTVPITAQSAPGTGRRKAPPIAHLLIVQLELDHGSPERYTMALAYHSGAEAEEMNKWHDEAVVADLRAEGVDGVLFDALYSPAYVKTMSDLLARRRSLVGGHGRVVGVPSTLLRHFDNCLKEDCPSTPLAAEQSNSSVTLGNQAIVKFIRRFEEGVNPGVELGRFLSERAHFPYSPRSGGSIEYRADTPGVAPATVAMLEEFIEHEDVGWDYVVDALSYGLEEALAHSGDAELNLNPPRSLFSLDRNDLEPAHPLVGPHLAWASLLGQRTAEMHAALTSDARDPDFAPEALTGVDRQALYHGARSLTRQVFREVGSLGLTSPHLQKALAREDEILARLRRFATFSAQAKRIRCHGDYHLGQVLWTGKDFVIIDFEGEPTRSLGRRRLKRPAAVDLAGMVRSLHYAGQAAELRLTRDLGIPIDGEEIERVEAWVTFWHRWVSGTFLEAYMALAAGAGYLPPERAQVAQILDFFLLEKAVYELSYEANSRPGWVDIPARGILDILAMGP
ncbi:MAG: maltose alpha-D-glucosyltransferase [Acidimicrobiales bacterium]|jgi:maltose alpha-D-glucosyltransferase/alpha-amylase